MTYIPGGGTAVETNVPIINNISGQTCELVSKIGASISLVVVLSNDEEYTATSPLSLNLAVSGLLGMEASSHPIQNDTWYYVYAVKAVASGTFTVIGSSKPPSAGPDDYVEWFYLGALRHGTGVLLDQVAHVNGDVFYKEQYEPAGSIAMGAGNEAKANLSLAEFVPPTAIGVYIHQWILHNNVGGFTVYSKTYVDGEANCNMVVVGTDVFACDSASSYCPIPDLNQIIEYESYDDHPGDIVANQHIYVNGYRDGYL